MERGNGFMTGLLFHALIFPGLLFVLTGAIFAGFADRKVTAAMESRVGPPTLQTLYDFIKLSVKQTHPSGPRGRRLSILPPLGSLTAAVLGSLLVWQAVFSPTAGFKGDFFAVAALLAAASPWQVKGVFTAPEGEAAVSGRFHTVNFFLTAELPFFMAAGVPFLQAGGFFRLGGLTSHQSVYGMAALSVSGAIAFAVVFSTGFAKLRFSPFDAAETGLQAFSGASARYSGFQLALHRLTPCILLFTMPALLTQLFWGGMSFRGTGIPESLLKYGLLFGAFLFIRNLSPRMTLSSAFKWHLGPATAAATVAVLLSIFRW
jgi:NADH-quinone oxidoreductase subunit H